MKKNVWLNRHHDDEFIDEILIKVVPRFKTSELSGDEWRVSTNVKAFRKGILVAERSWGKLEYALRMMDAWLIETLESGIANQINTDHLCFQPGCNKVATLEYKVKQEYCVGGGNCGSKLDSEWRDLHIRFCDDHRHRGDSDLQDADENYELFSDLTQ